MSDKAIWVPVKEPLVVVKQNEHGVTEVDQSIAFELKQLDPSTAGFRPPDAAMMRVGAPRR